MIVELFGLPASGKSTITAALAQEGWTRVAFADQKERWRFFMRAALRRPLAALGLLHMVVRYAGGKKLFYLKLMNLYVHALASYEKARELPKALLDQGPYQTLLSLFESLPRHESMRHLANLLPDPDLMLIVSIPEDERTHRLVARGVLPRTEYGESYAQAFNEARPEHMRRALPFVCGKLTAERVRVVATAKEARAALAAFAHYRPLMAHMEHLASYVPNLAGRRMLDVGAGKGKFLFAATVRGYTVTGLEYNPEYVASAHAEAKRRGITISLQEGAAEHMPFADQSFDFANVAEVIEHVDNPRLALQELHRVLTPGALAYISVPNRFGFIDPHYHLPFLNWMPRGLADLFVKGKKDGAAGRQRLSSMHYYTYDAFRALAARCGFSVQDIRSRRINAQYHGVLRPIAHFAYSLLRFFYFDTAHLLLRRESLVFSYITIARMPTEKAHGISIAHLCANVAQEGNAVDLVVPTRANDIDADVFTYYGVPKVFSVRRVPGFDFIGRGLTHPLFFALQRLLFVLEVKRTHLPMGIVYTREPEIAAAFSRTHRTAYEAHRWPKGVAGWLTAQLVRNADLVVCNSEGTEAAARRAGVTRTFVAPNGFDPAAFEKAQSKKDARKRLSLPQGAKIALYIGAVEKRKGIETLLNATDYLKDVLVTIIGGSDRQVEQLSERYPKVRFLGFHPYHELADNLAAADVLVLPNTAQDLESAEFTSPIKLFGYMASGVPLVASDVPALRTILSDDVALLVPSDNSRALADGIQEAVKDTAEARKRAVQAARVVEAYTWHARARKILEAI